MLGRWWQKLRSTDWLINLMAGLLLFFGLVEIYSIGLAGEVKDLTNFNHQLLFAALGLGCLFYLAWLDYHRLYGFVNYFYLAVAVALIIVLFAGQTINGTKGWLGLFGFGIQPVEFVKLVLLLSLAKYFSESGDAHNPLRRLLISGAIAAPLVLLVMIQPDFGSAVILVFIWLFMVLLAGLPRRYLLFLLGGTLILILPLWFLFFKPYQKERILTFWNPQAKSISQSYNVNQAMIAIGAGGLYGKGLSFGSQSQLKFLPEAKTDFIFSVVAEELGFIGVALILSFFGVMLYRLTLGLARVKDDFGAFFVSGCAALIFLEMFINIGMNMGLVPVVGIALPLISYGGSSVIANLMMMGVCQSVISRART